MPASTSDVVLSPASMSVLIGAFAASLASGLNPEMISRRCWMFLIAKMMRTRDGTNMIKANPGGAMYVMIMRIVFNSSPFWFESSLNDINMFVASSMKSRELT